ncbi:hypothetical protein [Micromonospora sp. LOL_023]|uniref:hypothetical protein n=1 Tax=Micromonospora sp. LOL_023 TaxID=3345418 RepID=UPI003A8BF7F1
MIFPRIYVANARGIRIPVSYAAGSAFVGAAVAGLVSWIAAGGAAVAADVSPAMVGVHVLVAARYCFLLGLVFGVLALIQARWHTTFPTRDNEARVATADSHR